jgi:hypothetical protein
MVLATLSNRQPVGRVRDINGLNYGKALQNSSLSADVGR